MELPLTKKDHETISLQDLFVESGNRVIQKSLQKMEKRLSKMPPAERKHWHYKEKQLYHFAVNFALFFNPHHICDECFPLFNQTFVKSKYYKKQNTTHKQLLYFKERLSELQNQQKCDLHVKLFTKLLENIDNFIEYYENIKTISKQINKTTPFKLRSISISLPFDVNKLSF